MPFGPRSATRKDDQRPPPLDDDLQPRSAHHDVVPLDHASVVPDRQGLTRVRVIPVSTRKSPSDSAKQLSCPRALVLGVAIGAVGRRLVARELPEEGIEPSGGASFRVGSAQPESSRRHRRTARAGKPSTRLKAAVATFHPEIDALLGRRCLPPYPVPLLLRENREQWRAERIEARDPTIVQITPACRDRSICHRRKVSTQT